MNLRPLVVAATLACLAAAPPVRPPDEPLTGLLARPLGPAVMGGRITSLAVVENSPAIQYVGAAAGGVWKTTDDGLSWTPVFEGRPHPSIGAIAVAASNPRVVWVGTGEANPRNSVSWGNGVFVSCDAGKTWRHAGLTGTHHIGRIVIHPHNPKVVYVAALGRLFGPSRERGLYRTRDGGETWEQVIKLDRETGCIDVAIDPIEPRTLYAAAYRVRRDGFAGGNPAVQFGPLAGIYRTDDGGETWQRLRRGLPDRPLGRIGLAMWRRDPRILYTVIQTDRTDITRVSGQGPGLGPIDTGGVFRSRDRGETWVKVNDLCPRPFYFGQVRIDPNDEQRVWVLGIPLFFSADGGRTFRNDAARQVHVDHHDLWINPADPRHLVLGNDGGLYYSRDRGQRWTAVKNLPIAQFYGVGVDLRRPYWIYGGLQDNGTWGGPSRTRNPSGVLNDDWVHLLGYDGFHCQVPPDDPNTLYAEGQYGRLHSIDLTTRRARSIRPEPASPQAPAYRFNWNAPLVVSSHPGRTVYYGGNHVFRSFDRGTHWAVISPDLTHGKPGPAPSTGHTLTALAESPLRPGLLYAGSDDGRVHVTRNDGRTWTDVSAALPGVPAERWITRLECSPHAAGTAWLSLTRHRQDDRAPYLFRTNDFGKTWTPITGGLPAEGPVHVVRADVRNPDLLFAGTEFGLFVSLDAGRAWRPVRAGLPPVPVHDLLIHSRDRELVIATHGRGVYVLDVAPLQELTSKVRAGGAYLCDVRPVVIGGTNRHVLPQRHTYRAPNPPAAAVIYYYLTGQGGPGTLEVLTGDGTTAVKWEFQASAGLHRVVWDVARARMPAGEYRARLRIAGVETTRKVRVQAE